MCRQGTNRCQTSSTETKKQIEFQHCLYKILVHFPRTYGALNLCQVFTLTRSREMLLLTLGRQGRGAERDMAYLQDSHLAQRPVPMGFCTSYSNWNYSSSENSNSQAVQRLQTGPQFYLDPNHVWDLAFMSTFCLLV